jgi:hypothetical protein
VSLFPFDQNNLVLFISSTVSIYLSGKNRRRPFLFVNKPLPSKVPIFYVIYAIPQSWVQICNHYHMYSQLDCFISRSEKRNRNHHVWSYRCSDDYGWQHSFILDLSFVAKGKCYTLILFNLF